MDGEDVLATDDVARGEVDAPHAGQYLNGGRVQFHEIAGALRDIVPRFAPCVGPRPAAFLSPVGPHHGRLVELPAAAQAGECAADSRGGDSPSLASQQGDELELPPARILLTQLLDAGDEPRGRLRLTDAAGSPRAVVIFETLQASRIKSVPPAVEGGRADPKVPAGKAGMAATAGAGGRPSTSRAGYGHAALQGATLPGRSWGQDNAP